MLRTRRSAPVARPLAAGEQRPVLLATFDVPLDPDASAFAVDAAVESGHGLLVVNAVELPMRPMTASWGTDVVVAEDVERSLAEPAALAASLAVAVERIRLVSPRPVSALLELVAERSPGLLVVGPDRARLRRGTYRRIARRVRDEAPCLVWLSSS